MEDSHFSGQVRGAGFRVGGLVGYNYSGSFIRRSYSTASVTATIPRVHQERQRLMFSRESNTAWGLGGLVGGNYGSIVSSYATGRVSGNGDRVGGLVGYTDTAGGGTEFIANYAIGDVSSSGRFVGGLVGHAWWPRIKGSYSLGAVSGGETVGGLVGLLERQTIVDSYWNYHTDTPTATVTAHLASDEVEYPNGANRTAAELQRPTGYTGIYARWNTFTGSDGKTPAWDFGTSGDFPVLSDTGPSVAAQRARMPGAPTHPPAGPSPDQRRHASLTDYDTDDDRLIEVSNFRQLFALHVDNRGEGKVSWSDDYLWAFPNPQDQMGCPGGCIGYELTTDLDFDTNGNGRIDPGDDYYNGVHYPDDSAYCQNWYLHHPVQETKDRAGACDDYWGNDAEGWRPLSQQGPRRTFNAVFEGNGHTIRNLYINTLDPPYTEEQLNAVNIYGLPACCGDDYPDFRGLFFELGIYAVVRNLRLENVDVSGKAFVGALAGTNSGKISNVHVTGTVSGKQDVGGLVGFNYGSGVITASSATASVEGRAVPGAGGRNVGGLTGLNQGTIRASHATGAVSGLAHNTGGLVGYNDGGSIAAAYAAGPAHTRSWNAGGLVGRNRGDIAVSYSIGYSWGCDSSAGGLVGHHAGGAVTGSYWDTQTSGYAASPVGVGKTTSELQTPDGYVGIYAGWNVDVNGDGSPEDPWDFGTSGQYPVLKYGGLNPAAQRTAIAARAPAPPAESADGPNRAPTLAAPLGGIVFGRDGGARQISLNERFHDLDCDPLSIKAGSANETVATVSLAGDGSSLTVNALSPGTATVTVEASDGRGGAVSHSFTVTVKNVPRLRTDVHGLEGLRDVVGLLPGRTSKMLVMFTDDDDGQDLPPARAVSSDGNVVAASLRSTDQGHPWCGSSQHHCYTVTVKGVSAGTATVTVTVRDSDGNQAGGSFEASTITPSDDDATLQSLSISRGRLAFDPATTAYTVNLPFTVREVTLSPVATHPDAEVTVNGEEPGAPLPLRRGETVVNNVVVTAADGETTKTYTVTVSRAPSANIFITAYYDIWSDDEDMTVRDMEFPEGLELDSEFRSDEYTYDLTVPDDLDSLTFTGVLPRTPRSPKVAVGLLAVGTDLPLFEEAMIAPTHENIELINDYIIAKITRSWGVRRIGLEMDATTVIQIAVYKSHIGGWYTFQRASVNESRMDRKVVYTLNVTRGDPNRMQQRRAATWSVSPAQSSVAEGQSANLTLTLSEAAPADGLAFTVTPRYDGDATAAAADVGSVTSPVTVAAGRRSLSISIPTVDDAAEEKAETFTVVVATSAAGWAKAGDGKDTATLTITDNDTPGVTVTAASPLAVDEGQGASYTVALDSQPAKDVTITPQSADVDAVLVTPPWYKFTPSTWNTPATFQVSGVADDDTNDESVGISHRITSADTRYANLLVASVQVSVSDTTPANQQQVNNAPTVASAIADVIIVSESGTHEASLSGVFADADGDALTVTAKSSDTAKATVSVATDGSSLTVTAKARGTATITVSAADGNGGTVEDAFTVAVKAAPVVAQAISDVSGLEVGDTREVSLTGVFSDADGDALTVTASSSSNALVKVSADLDGSGLTAIAVDEGTATVTVTARDADGNSVSDAFEVSVVAASGQQQQAPPANSFTIRLDTAFGNLVGWVQARGEGALVSGDATFGGRAVNGLIRMDAGRVRLSMETGTDSSEFPTRIEISDGAGWTATFDSPSGFTGRGLGMQADYTGDASGLTAGRQVTVALGGPAPTPANNAPTVASAIADATIVNESGTSQASLSGVFNDADGDSLTVTAKSSDTAKATVSVATDGSTLTVTAKARGTATITATASDGNGGTVDDAFTVTVKAAPTVASAIADVSGLEAGDTRDVSLSGVFSDADGDALTITAASSNTAKVTAAVASDGSRLTLAGVAEGNATITVTAQDSDGNQASDAFQVEVVEAQQQAKPEGPEPWDIQIVPGDGQLTVTWKVGSHDVDDAEVRHALRWSQEPGVWANPKDPNAGGPEDGVAMEGGVTSYVITGLKNDVPTGVFVRSFTGDSASERSPESSKWVRVKGDNTTPRAAD